MDIFSIEFQLIWIEYSTKMDFLCVCVCFKLHTRKLVEILSFPKVKINN